MEALGLNLGYVLLQLCMFGIVFVVLRAWIYNPVTGMLEKRRQKIAQGLEDARVAGDARSNAERDASQILAEAQAKSSQMIREATERAEAVAQETRTQTEAEFAKERAAILAEAEQERNRLLGDLRSQVAALAIAAAQRIIGEAMDTQRQHALLDEFFSGVKAGRVVVLADSPLSGTTAEVTSALPLTEAEQLAVRSDLLKKLGPDAPVAFRVDPSILGGLVVKVGDKVMDGSVAGQLQTLRQVINS